MKKIRRPNGGKYIAPPKCEWHHDRSRPCQSSMVYASGRPFLYRLRATIIDSGAVIANRDLVFCQRHLEEQEEKAKRSPQSVEIEWELICEADSQPQRI